MTALTLVKIGLRNGVWGALISGSNKPPEILVRCADQIIEGVELSKTAETDQWDLSVPVPAELISDGAQVFEVIDMATKNKLADFCVVAGDASDSDLRTELALLRAELDMMKQAFRRYCSDKS